MEFRARHKWLRLSPTKARLVADAVRGLDVQEAIDALKFMPQKAALFIGKAVRSALANAREHKGEEKPDVDKLYVRTLMVDGGPTIKRIKPRAYGRAHRKRRRTSHIVVVLAERPADQAPRRRARTTAHPVREPGPHPQALEGEAAAPAAPTKPKKPRRLGFGRREKYDAKVKGEKQPRAPKEKATGEHRKTESGTKGGSKKK
jgi:large subunit ribosomal protein L22